MRRLVILAGRILGPLFYDRKYLKGRFFSSKGNNVGWIWVVKGILRQKLMGFNVSVPWPMNFSSQLSNWQNIEFDVDDLNIFQSQGCYFQNFSAQIVLGKGTFIGPNVGLITANHDFTNLDKHVNGEPINIGKNCWIGMNSVILPGVKLGNNTVVGAGSIVTKSFVEGNMVIAGNPAKKIRNIKNKLGNI